MNDFEKLKNNYYLRVGTGYGQSVNTLLESDIVLHLPILEYYASQCNHVTEFGVREGHSTVALLSGCKGLVKSYDINRDNIVNILSSIELPCKWIFAQADTTKIEIDSTELLFVDTLHYYEHIKKELELHGNKSSRYLIFHDTETCGEIDRSGNQGKGILPAIKEFIKDDWKTVYWTKHNHGLWVLERK